MFSIEFQKALLLAIRAHEMQVDKSGTGEPYITHPLRVSEKVRQMCLEHGIDVELCRKARIVALLHDVVEDTFLSIEDIRLEGFDERIVKAIDAMSKRANETELSYLSRVKEDYLATIVKIADLRDNYFNPHRITHLHGSEKSKMQYIEKKRAILNMLISTL